MDRRNLVEKSSSYEAVKRAADVASGSVAVRLAAKIYSSGKRFFYNTWKSSATHMLAAGIYRECSKDPRLFITLILFTIAGTDLVFSAVVGVAVWHRPAILFAAGLITLRLRKDFFYRVNIVFKNSFIYKLLTGEI